MGKNRNFDRNDRNQENKNVRLSQFYLSMNSNDFKHLVDDASLNAAVVSELTKVKGQKRAVYRKIKHMHDTTNLKPGKM